ncbi:polyprenyl synthetase family protein [Sunxiuqinia elliptica]|uniref:Geranylgeranyl diphosphate synthase type II n=1 Tax=Sunxiuqinia elliptica TaxID=655355 RepID=A0A4R6H7S8_9BACT|nr:polyprenyl synthetase family protein [Sunxiuqinia elliptica]TDO04017.1 geranylgeranyl diphosphate synthase type II [Sunxiuqinia elliptica]TDO62299.1 geranylgeranyl diphosphate synthase type II [Sunxiuqinia elliptica]
MKPMHSIQELQQLVIDKLAEEASAIAVTEPVNLYEPITYTLNMGGKRLRPAMLLMACDLFSGDIKNMLNAAVAVEVFHNFTLLHDDIMDHADIRRNQPAVHKKYNENVAILSGDAMSIMAYQYLLKINHPAIQEVTQLFSKTAMEVCEGQQYDMDFEHRQDVSIDEYLKMIRLKTAVLIAGSLKMGALLGGTDSANADRLYRFGINMGLAFQLQDDLLDVFADQEKFGKKIGGDIVANKKTFLLLKALEIASPKQKQALQYWIENNDFDPKEKIDAVRTIYTDLNLKEISEQLAETYYQKALNEIQAIEVASERKEPLILLAKTILKREH